ncbi:hypothetical protein [Streptomyces sp. BBFR115]|uniref:hypothetical protein n=1 Tax=Streptomyces sp. BBFR115 TaxID=3448173 RepID=UPI003F76A929
MPQPEIRPHVMALLFDTNFNRPPGTRIFRHLDGRPFTDEEQALADDATLEELQAAGVHVHDPEAEVEAAAHQLAELLFKYVLPHRTALIPFMTHEDMLEYGRLETVIAAGAHSLRPHKD